MSEHSDGEESDSELSEQSDGEESDSELFEKSDSRENDSESEEDIKYMKGFGDIKFVGDKSYERADSKSDKRKGSEILAKLVRKDMKKILNI